MRRSLSEEVFSTVRVKILRIEAIQDADGVPGKKIDLVEERQPPPTQALMSNPEARMIAESAVQAMRQLQMPVFQVQSQIYPKIVLYLTEDEYEQLGIHFDVNQIYEIAFKDGKIAFTQIR